MSTATEVAMSARDRERDERSLHERMRWFSEKYTEGMDKRAAAEFHADLMMVVQAIHRDASRETHELLKRSLAAMPPAKIFVNPKE